MVVFCLPGCASTMKSVNLNFKINKGKRKKKSLHKIKIYLESISLPERFF